MKRKYFNLFAVAIAALLVLTASSVDAGETQLVNALNALKGHVDETVPLSGSQIASHKSTLDSNKNIFGNSAATITASFDLVQAYEQNIGPMWSAGSPTESGYSRQDTSDQDIHWTVFHAMQYIMDDTYNSGNITTYQTLLDGYKFGSADVFPGVVSPPSNPTAVHTVSIDGSFLDTWGRNTMHWADADRPARKATGTYLAPGSIATITVPASLVNQGYQVRVGGNAWDFSHKNPVDRLDRVSLAYDINSTSIEVASPLGGNIYIEVPFEADAGVVSIDIQNAVRSPFFSMQDHNTTTLSEWQNTERNHHAPWADFQSEKYMMHVPTGWVYALDDPETLMENWEKALDVTNDLMGFPRDRGKETLFNQVDVRIRSSGYSPGYPQINNTYDPLKNQDASGWNTNGNAYDGEKSSYLIQGPQNPPDFEFHELGHAYLFPKLPGETESAVNLLHVAVLNQAFNVDLQQAFRTSMRGHNDSYYTLDTTAINWMTSFNFFTRKEPMEETQKRYKLPGHAKFVEFARVFGWDKLGDYYQSFNEDYEALGFTPSYSIDDHLLRLSLAAGEDATPLFHFWGIHPQNSISLKADLEAAGIGPSRDVYELLLHYKSLVPEDNAAFRQSALDWWGHQPETDGRWTERDHARQWDNEDLSHIVYDESDPDIYIPLQLPNGEMYTEDSAALIRGTIDDLLLQYYLEFLGDLNGDESLNGADWVIFITNAQSDMSGLTTEQSLALGDLDGDLDNDIEDFDLFRRAYELANPEPGAFAAMVAATSVPEPGSLSLLLVGAAACCLWRRRRRRI